MKLYLSSYKLGNEIEKLKTLLSAVNKKTAYIPNALDFSDGLERRKISEQSDMNQLTTLGLDVELVDLRDYFDNPTELEKKLSESGVIWVRGGNIFVLRQAMRMSGFDVIIKKLATRDDLLYGGYSAGICVLAPTLHGMELMDDPTAKPYGDNLEVIWGGLHILPYSIIPHYNSDHIESESAQKTVEYMTKNNMPFKTLADGEVIIL
ncbi:MAG: Type 1 glutamine amidotransferase-like domain-containing protein [bacterium]|nr:Type 1 glutamine amidotransferase-like domain-containing protein [bacterium]